MNDQITVPVPLVPVESSTIAAIGYSYFGAALYVQFKTGVVYRYNTVPERRFLAFVAAESKGAFFAATFKDASKYPCTKLGMLPLPVAAKATIQIAADEREAYETVARAAGGVVSYVMGIRNAGPEDVADLMAALDRLAVIQDADTFNAEAAL